MRKSKLMRSFLSLVVGVGILGIPSIANAEFNLDSLQKKVNDFIQQVQPGNQPSPNSNNTLVINPNETKTTNEITQQNPNITLLCKDTPGACRFDLKILSKKTSPDNYTTYEILKTEVINLTNNMATNVVITNGQGTYLLSMKNLNKIPMTIEYKVNEGSNTNTNKTPSLPNNTNNNSNTQRESSSKNVTNLGRIWFEQAAVLITPELTKGNYVFTIIPSDRRKDIKFIPSGIGVITNVYVVNKQGVKIPISLNRVGSFTIPNPLLTHKDSSIIIELTVPQDKAFIYVIGI